MKDISFRQALFSNWRMKRLTEPGLGASISEIHDYETKITSRNTWLIFWGIIVVHLLWLAVAVVR